MGRRRARRPSPTPAIDRPTLAEQLRAGDVVLLDVRDDDEWAEGHVAGSVHVPYMSSGTACPAELAANGKPIAVACSTGQPQRDRRVAARARAASGNVDPRRPTAASRTCAGEGIELVGGAG